MSLACLPDDFYAIRGLHGVVPIPMEDDEGHRLDGLPWRLRNSAWQGLQTRQSTAPAFHRRQR